MQFDFKLLIQRRSLLIQFFISSLVFLLNNFDFLKLVHHIKNFRTTLKHYYFELGFRITLLESNLQYYIFAIKMSRKWSGFISFSIPLNIKLPTFSSPVNYFRINGAAWTWADRPNILYFRHWFTLSFLHLATM